MSLGQRGVWKHLSLILSSDIATKKPGSGSDWLPFNLSAEIQAMGKRWKKKTEMIFKGTRQLLDLPRVTLLTLDNVLKLVCT